MPESFFRRVADQMLEAETEKHIAEQKTALEKHPEWAEGHYHLAQFYRVQYGRREEARRELLIALELKPSFADAHVALGEIYLTEDDLARARQHAEFAAMFGNRRLLEQLERHGR